MATTTSPEKKIEVMRSAFMEAGDALSLKIDRARCVLSTLIGNDHHQCLSRDILAGTLSAAEYLLEEAEKDLTAMENAVLQRK